VRKRRGQVGLIFTENGIFTCVVKKREVINIGGAFPAEALRILREIPGLTVVAEPAAPDRGIDATLRFADSRTPVAVEFKQRANAATAWQLVQLAQAQPGTPLLLVSGQTTAKAREILEGHGIAVVDGLGNAHIELPGLLFHLEGRGRPRGTRLTVSPTRLRGKAGLVAQALLLNPERVWHVKDLTGEAQVSAGLAHRVLTRLERERIVAAEGTGPKRWRRLTNPTALLDLWAEENVWAEEDVDRHTRIHAYLLAQTPRRLIKDLGGSLGRSRINYALTGAAAGSLVAPIVTAVPVVEVWVEATAAAEQLYDATGATPVAEGQNVVFLQAKDDAPLAFREQANDLWVVNRFRLYIDLRRDPRRGSEQADHLRREVIGF